MFVKLQIVNMLGSHHVSLLKKVKAIRQFIEAETHHSMTLSVLLQLENFPMEMLV